MARHLAVAGPSGGGKTTYLREQHAKFDGISIFLTTKKDERTAKSDPPARIRKSSCSYPEDIEQSREWALGREEDVQIIIDESHNAPSFQSGEGPLDTGIREDREYGIRYVVATQNPQNWNNSKDGYGLAQQCDYWVFVGPAKDWHVGFFNANNMSGLENHLPAVDFRYVVIEPIAKYSNEEKIKYEGRTSKRYG